LGREISAGRIKSKQEVQNFLYTGDAKTTYTPPPSKPPPTKPASMSQAQWDRYQAMRRQPTPQPSSSGNAAVERLQGM
jgi:hypothetical protein